MKNMKKKLFAGLMVFCFAALLAGCGSTQPQSADAGKPAETTTLFAYVGANLKEPFTKLAEDYEQETGVKIECTFNNSGALLNQMQTMKTGDLYMPGGMPFVKRAEEAGCIDKMEGPIAIHTPVIVTPKGNPAQIHSLQDLAREDVQLVLPDQEATAIGKTISKVFARSGNGPAIEARIIANVETPAKVMAAITMGQGNAGIVEYSNTVKARDKVELIPIDEGLNITEDIPIASLRFSAHKEQAEAFLQYVREKGPEVFASYGFKTK